MSVGAWVAAAVAGLLLLAGLALGLVFVAMLDGPTAGGCGGDGGFGGGGQQLGGRSFSGEQTANAATITAAAAAAGLGQRAAVIGVATALQESGLRNLREGDRDSLGLFQQRPSQGWGSSAQILTPALAAKRFFDRLAGVPGWERLPLTVAAQAVQRSAAPDAYAAHEAAATALVARFWTVPATGPAGGGGGLPGRGSAGAAGGTPALPGAAVGGAGFTPGCGDLGGSNLALGTGGGPDRTGHAVAGLPAGFALPTDPQQAAVVGFALAQLGKPYAWGAEGPGAFDCSGLVQAAYAAAGIPLTRSTNTQVHDGVAVAELGRATPGDLLFIPGADGTPAHPGHVGIYAGAGVVVDAYDSARGVILESVASWSNKVVAIRHVTGPATPGMLGAPA